MPIDQKILQKMAKGEYAPVENADEGNYDFECPECRGSHFGSHRGIFNCHDEYMTDCQWQGSKNECFVITKEQLARELLDAQKIIVKLTDKIAAGLCRK
jgi:hypothetical protein